MGLRTLYRMPAESARHEQIRILIQEYFTQNQKLMDNPSRRYAERARKALVTLKKVMHQRGLELLELYSKGKNPGKEAINDKHKHRIITADKQDAGRQGQETSTTDAN